MSALPEPFRIAGYYSQPYNEIVHPDRVWRVSKYFLRRWAPYLTPSRFWAIVAARQLAYWNDKCRWFTVYDRRFAQEAQLSTVHFRRLKTELEQSDQALSLFLTKKELADNEKYHVVSGQTKPRPTTYTIRLDDPLTPADALHLAGWLQQQASRQAGSVAAALQAARDLPRNTLLAPVLTPYLTNPPAVFRPLFVLDVVEQVFGAQIARDEAVKEAADLLHAFLTDPDYFGREYFRRQWLTKLKSGPAFLLTYLRSYCYFNEETGELRNEIRFTRPELADSLGVTTRTIVNWLKKLETAVPAQALPAFITLIEQKRLPSNDVQYTYQVELMEPLTKSDLRQYRDRLQTAEIDPAATAVTDPEMMPVQTPSGKNDHHDLTADGKNDYHDPAPTGVGAGKNDHHAAALMEKMITGGGKNDHGSVKKRWPFNYYQRLLQTIKKEEGSSFAAVNWEPGWKIDDELALLPFADAVCHQNANTLFDLLGVDPVGPTRKRLLAAGLDLAAMVAWYLYAEQQSGLTRPPLNLAIARIQSGDQPPQTFLSLANLSWELWRCYASLLVAHPALRDTFRDAPHFALWLSVYGRHHAEALPLGVGEGIAPFVQTHQAVSGDLTAPDAALETAYCVETDRDLWQPVLQELAHSMSKATFNAWLKGSVLLTTAADGVGTDEWTIGVRNEQAVAWLTARLNSRVIEPLATALHGKPKRIRYLVFNE